MLKRIIFILIQFISVVCTYATENHYDSFIDTLSELPSFERRRMIHGYAEAYANRLNEKPERERFLQILKDFALVQKDDALLNEINLMKRKQVEVMDFSRSEREAKLLALIAKYEKSKDLYFLGFCYHELGQIYFQQGNYAESFINDLKALEVYKKIGYDKVPNIGKILHEIALHYYFFRDYEEVIKLMEQSFEFPAFNKTLDLQRYNNMGLSYLNLGMNTQAIHYFKKGFDLSEDYQSEIWRGILAGNLGKAYYNSENYSKAYYYFKKCYEINKDEDLHLTVKVNSIINMINIHLQLDSIQQAKDFLLHFEKSLPELNRMSVTYLDAKHLGDRQHFEITKKKYFEGKIKYLKKTNNFALAVSYQDSLIEVSQLIEEKYNSAIGKMASDQLTIQNKEMELIRNEKSKENQRYFYLFILLTTALIGGLSYFQLYRLNQKKVRQSERLLAQSRITILENQQSKKELEHSKSELNNFVSKVNELNKIISGMEDELLHLKDLKCEQKIDIEQSLKNLKSVKILTDDDWFDFQDNFEKIFPEYVYALKNYKPNLTPSEIRYLMLIKLGLNNKEMARALVVSEAAIRMTWSRVRKKLNGSIEEKPLELIERLVEEYSYEFEAT